MINYVQKVLKHVKGKHIAIWGLSFKPNTDDIRFAPSLYIIDKLLAKGYTISAYDPAAQKNIQNKIGDKKLHPANGWVLIQQKIRSTLLYND